MITATILLASWAGLTTWITAMGVFLGALTVTLVALAGTFKAISALGLGKPFKWLWRSLISNSINDWLHDVMSKQLEEIKHELQVNSGGSVKDAVLRHTKDLEQLRNEMAKIGEEIKQEIKDK